MVRSLFCVALIAWLGCGGDSRECANGSVCPRGFSCVDGPMGGCALPEQFAACEGRADGSLCDALGGQSECAGGVCLIGICGDGVQTVGEACDDGNTDDGDACSADCTSDGSCGNGIVDAGEECDCGAGESLSEACSAPNSDDAFASCRTDCRAHCGDGEVNEAEDCEGSALAGGCFEFGFDRGALPCVDCAADFSECARFGSRPIPSPGLVGEFPLDAWSAPDGTIFALSSNTVTGGGAAGWSSDSVVSTVDVTVNMVAVDGWQNGEAFALAQRSATMGGIAPQVLRFTPSQGLDALPFDANLASVLPRDLWVGSDTDFVLVGGILGQPTGRIFSFDGATWTLEASPPIVVRAVHGSSSGDTVLAVGGNLATWRISGVWSVPESVPGASDLQTAWLNEDGTAFAAGAAGTIFYHDGESWTSLPGPSVGEVRSVIGRGGSDVYAVAEGALFHSEGGQLMRVADDASGFEYRSAALGAGTFVVLGRHFETREILSDGWRVAAEADLLGPAACSAVAGVVMQMSNERLRVWNGTTLRDLSLPVITTGIDGVLVAENSAYVLTAPGFGDPQARQVRHWQGLSGFPVAHAIGTGHGVSIAAASASDVIVGVNDAAGPVTSEIHRYDGAAWTVHELPLGAGDEVADVAYLDGTSAAALTVNGQIWSFDGTGFTLLHETGVANARVFWGQGGEVFVGGASGVVARYAAEEWTSVTLSSEQIVSLDGTDPDNVIASTASVAYFFDGTNWSPVRTTLDSVVGICMTEGDLFGTTGEGRFARFRRTVPWQ